jgi:putative transposase
MIRSMRLLAVGTSYRAVKHGWAQSVSDWPYSSFHRYVEQGVYPENWENHAGYDIEGLE